MVLPPITVPTFLQPIIQAWIAWFITTFVSIPAATFFMIWDIPRSISGLLFRERPKVVLITGASSGIGEKFAEEYAKLPGVTLGLLARNEDRLEKVADSCRKRGAKVETMSCDISRVDALVDTIEDFCNRNPVDLLIANAAQTGVKYDDIDTWEDMWERLFAVNINGTVATVMTVFKKMKENRNGQIAIVSSVVGHFSVPQMIYYNTTKSALLSFARDLRYLASRHNVKVSVIAPGLIDTPMSSDPNQPISMFRLIFSSPRNLAVIAKLQLYENWFEVTWPFLEMLPAYAAQTLPPRVLEAVTYLVGNFGELIWGTNGTAFT